METYILVAVLLVAFSLWSAISPRSQWRALQGWRYKNPDANEPSDVAYGLTRVGGIIAIIVVVVVGIIVASLSTSA